MKLLVDSDFLFALFQPDDSNNDKARSLLLKYEKEDLCAINLVVQESTTLVSKRMNMKYAKSFYESICNMIPEIIMLNENLEKDAWKIFLSQNKKGTSFVDCANLATYQKLKLDGILSFDDFYPKDKLVSTKNAK
jgi:predicted nucleic acid-binding protein